MQFTQKTISKPQRVQWIASGADAPGLLVRTIAEPDGNIEREEFIPWDSLRSELEEKLLTNAFADPRPYAIRLEEHHGKPNWLMQVYEKESGRPYCSLWLGVNPDNGWAFDGLIHFGGEESPHVWQTYQRYSDGRYSRLPSAYGTLERAKD